MSKPGHRDYRKCSLGHRSLDRFAQVSKNSAKIGDRPLFTKSNKEEVTNLENLGHEVPANLDILGHEVPDTVPYTTILVAFQKVSDCLKYRLRYKISRTSAEGMETFQIKRHCDGLYQTL